MSEWAFFVAASTEDVMKNVKVQKGSSDTCSVQIPRLEIGSNGPDARRLVVSHSPMNKGALKSRASSATLSVPRLSTYSTPHPPPANTNTQPRYLLKQQSPNTFIPNPPPSQTLPIMVLGKVAHYAFDAVLISAFLAGVRRSTGLTPSVKPDSFSENPSAQKWFENYLWVGETVMDQSVALFGASSYFERKR
ncbi:DUF1748 domain containing [Pyrenophora seminiperda CCB06]|uniref:DUF1748 domain containing n=3 Tax=Pyrenophora TaxID=5027 RepID=A0A3M7MER9_9PLEO|nr:DUF1748 domain containing [Pyrenophora seminiperda CCB06]